jgi:hypothetical protein
MKKMRMPASTSAAMVPVDRPFPPTAADAEILEADGVLDDVEGGLANSQDSSHGKMR